MPGVQGAPEGVPAGKDGEDSEADGEGMDELVELQLKEEIRLETLFGEQRDKHGIDSDITLKTFFKLFDMWIQLYRLNKCAEVLPEIVKVCRDRGGNFHIQGVQALAFTKWKQGKFKEALDLFHEIERTIGSSAALCENMGHTYSSLGDYNEASNYFKRSLLCLDEEEKLGKGTGDRAGVMLGLGLIEDRLEHYDKALIACREAQRLFRNRANGKPSSLIAKAGMSIAKILLKCARAEKDADKRKQMEEEAIEKEEENVVIFEITCGEDSPLTASALKGLGEALMQRQRFKEAQARFARSYWVEAQKDAFDLITVMEVHNLLFSAHMAAVRAGGELDRAAFGTYLPTIEIALQRVRDMPQDANAGAYYKVAGEMQAFAEDYRGAAALLGQAVELFKTEEEDKVSGLIHASNDLKDFCEKQIIAQRGVSPAAAG